MSTNIIPFSSSGNDVPAHIAAMFDGEGNIAARISIDQLSYRGKVWRRIVGGEETQLTRTSSDGEVEPVPIVSVVVLDHNKGRSRAFYEGAYEEGKNASPTCYSGDGVTPDEGVKEPCAKTCATCPNSVKGSKITENGKQTTACSPFKRVAIVPSAGLAAHPVLLLRLAQTSVWDKDNGENEAKGWYAWDQYLDMLRARGAKHTAAVETKVKFDLRMAYPKLLFSASRWLNPEETTAAKARIAESTEVIEIILSGLGNDGVAGKPATGAAEPADQPVEDPTIAAAAAAAAQKAAAKAAKQAAAAKALAEAQAAAAAAAEDDEDDDAGEGGGFGDMTAAAPAAVAKPATKPAAKAATAAKAPKAAAATPVENPATVVEGTPSGLSDLLAGWDA